jgi:hypothetical protein
MGMFFGRLITSRLVPTGLAIAVLAGSVLPILGAGFPRDAAGCAVDHPIVGGERRCPAPAAIRWDFDSALAWMVRPSESHKLSVTGVAVMAGGRRMRPLSGADDLMSEAPSCPTPSEVTQHVRLQI